LVNDETQRDSEANAWSAGKNAGAADSHPAMADHQNLPRIPAQLAMLGNWRPSDVLGFGGPLPIYSCVGAIDNCNFSEQTIWSSEAVRYSRTLVLEGTALQIESGSYDGVIASHCLEHIANPIRAVPEWKRLLPRDGLLSLILAHPQYTFDWRRPVTILDHMKNDYVADMPESDLTHLDEILSLHDLSRDSEVVPRNNFPKIAGQLQFPGATPSRISSRNCHRTVAGSRFFNSASGCAGISHHHACEKRLACATGLQP
jgi:SAM-dependent methyltransferase